VLLADQQKQDGGAGIVSIRLKGVISRLLIAVLLAWTGLEFNACGTTTQRSRDSVTTVYWSVAVGDLNGDALPDLAVSYTRFSNQAADAGFVAVYLQDPARPGKFLPAMNYPVGAVPKSIAIGDLNGDGKPDIVSANTTMEVSGPGSISVLIQNAASPGSFLTAVNYATGDNPSFIAIGDLQGDGAVDLAVADANGISIHLNNSCLPGTFLPVTSIRLGTAASSVAIADLNGDQKSDLVATTAENILVLLHSSIVPETFLPPVSYAAGLRPSSVAVADLNEDGKPDLAVANEGSPSDPTTASVSVLLQNTAQPGTFSAPTNYATDRESTLVVATDLNGDTEADLVVVNLGSISVLLHDLCLATHIFPAVNYEAANPVRWVAVGDVNGDGRPDLVIVAADGVEIRIQDQDHPGSFLAPTVITR